MWLPDPQGITTAKSYKSKIAEPLIKRMESLIKTLLVRFFQAIDDYQRLNQTNANPYRSNEWLKGHNKLLRKVFGNRQIDSLLEQEKQAKQRENTLEITILKGRNKEMARIIFEEMFSSLVRQMAEREGVTEQLKATDQMTWVRTMNNIRSSATEVINHVIVD